MKKLGLIGYPLTHSFSADYFAQKFITESIQDFSYKNYPLKSIEELPQLLLNEAELMGLNVTIPYKEKVLPYLHELDGKAKKIGAVNVIKKFNGKLYGYNSDYDGFKKSLFSFINDIRSISSALILGTGGASKAVAAVLSDIDITYKYVSRNSEIGITYNELNKNPQLIKDYQLIINCTPLGTFPEVQEKPDIPYNQLESFHYLYDLVYNPERTAYMVAGEERGAKTINGYQMLVEQAEEAWKIWQQNKPF